MSRNEITDSKFALGSLIIERDLKWVLILRYITMDDLYKTIQLQIMKESQKRHVLENSNVIPDYDEVIQKHPEIHVHVINQGNHHE